MNQGPSFGQHLNEEGLCLASSSRKVTIATTAEGLTQRLDPALISP
ncbi:MAG: hypothetical protein QOE83_7 [Actinomycetota bacterium]|nr:hypothetical protein [Actinomycetota bacterium]